MNSPTNSSDVARLSQRRRDPRATFDPFCYRAYVVSHSLPTPWPERGPEMTLLNPGDWPHTARVVDAMERVVSLERWGEGAAPRASAEARVRLAFEAYESGWDDTDPTSDRRRQAVSLADGWAELVEAIAERVPALQALDAAGARELADGVEIPLSPHRRDWLDRLAALVAEEARHPIEQLPGRKRLKRRGYAVARNWLAPVRSGVLADGREIGVKIADQELAYAMLEAPRAWRGCVCVDLAEECIEREAGNVDAAARELGKRITRALMG